MKEEKKRKRSTSELSVRISAIAPWSSMLQTDLHCAVTNENNLSKRRRTIITFISMLKIQRKKIYQRNYVNGIEYIVGFIGEQNIRLPDIFQIFLCIIREIQGITIALQLNLHNRYFRFFVSSNMNMAIYIMIKMLIREYMCKRLTIQV